MSMEQWWNDTDRGKLKYWEKNIIQRGCYEYDAVTLLMLSAELIVACRAGQKVNTVWAEWIVCRYYCT